ncbi:MAG: hypothetical protein KatS3mg129_0679 [Leptospiraceae bacterium]|nr:MAG: hypothetical protein KatS3mg129_0679 [Leptospiraceae bacterium]
MNKKFYILIFISISSLLGKPNWIKDWEYAKNLASKQKKPILIDFYSETCYYCKVIEKETYQSNEFNKWKQKLILTIIDGDKNPQIANEFQIIGYPTIILLDYNGVEIGRIEGYFPKNQLLKQIEYYYNKKDIYKQLTNNIKNDPLNYYHYFQLALYYDKAKQWQNTEKYLLKALYYLSPKNLHYYHNKKNILYNLAVINTRQKNYIKAFSYWNALIAWLKKEDKDYPIAKYYRAFTLLYKNQTDTIEYIAFNSLSAKEKNIVIDDLKYAINHLPDSLEKEFAKKLLSEIKP